VTRLFCHDGLNIAVDADAADQEWLEEFLAPAFVVRDGTDAAVRVVYTPVPTGAGSAEVGVEPGRVAFALDSGPVRLFERSDRDHVDVFMPGGALAFQVDVHEPVARVFHGTPGWQTRVRLMRVVREYAHNHSLRTGGLMLHAASIAMDGRAVAIAGAKGAGKTTLALRLLSANGVDYLSNDRLLVRSGVEVQAFGVPTVIAVRPGTRRLLPNLTEPLSRAGDFRMSTAERRARGPAPPDVTGDTWRTSARQVCEGLGCRQTRSARLAAVLFPSRTPLARGTFRRMGVDEANQALADSLVGLRAGYLSEVFTPPPNRRITSGDITSRARELASRVPCFVAHVSDATPPTEAAEWLDECLDQLK
jgi:hypothetical protein